jgi:predicted ferric reductase
MKPSRVPIVLYSLALFFHALAAVSYFLADKPIFGWIFAACALVWIATVRFSVLTYRSQKRTAEIYDRIGWPS